MSPKEVSKIISADDKLKEIDKDNFLSAISKDGTFEYAKGVETLLLDPYYNANKKLYKIDIRQFIKYTGPTDMEASIFKFRELFPESVYEISNINELPPLETTEESKIYRTILSKRGEVEVSQYVHIMKTLHEVTIMDTTKNYDRSSKTFHPKDPDLKSLGRFKLKEGIIGWDISYFFKHEYLYTIIDNSLVQSGL